jgi:Fic family protein
MVYGLFVKCDTLTEKKRQLDQFRPLPKELVANLDNWFRVELTYTSNALEGNTLTRQETAVVVEKGLTIGGKSLVEHLEATNHAAALNKVVQIAQSATADITEHTILDLHSTILHGIDDANAGRYRSIAVRISGSIVVLPNPLKVPTLMADFVKEMGTRSDLHPVELAAEAHYQLVTIHPFIDGNGRTARLLMNLLLLQKGYPPALIRKRDRVPYLKALEKAQLGGSKEDYYEIISKAVSRSFDIYFNALDPELEPLQKPTPLLRIGQLAKLTGEPHATLRHWMKEGLLEFSETTGAGYQLFDPEMVDRAKLIRHLQSERQTLAEIRKHIAEQKEDGPG